MDEKEQYKEVFSQVHTSVKVDVKEYQKMKAKKNPKKYALAAAAVIGVIVTCSATAYATNFLGVKDLTIDTKYVQEPKEVVKSEVITVTDDETGETREVVNEWTEMEPAQPKVNDQISLQGYPDSNEYKASAEWNAFLDEYDKDGAIINQIQNDPTGLERPPYNQYFVYTQEMADKLDEIAAKYDLKLHTDIYDVMSNEDLCEKAGVGFFLGPNDAASAYVYEDGTLHFDGDAYTFDDTQFSYQFSRYVKGCMNEVVLNIGNAEDYVNWPYVTDDGVTLNLSIGPDKALVFLDLPDAFLSINVLAGTNEGWYGPITARDLEIFADSFQWTALKK